MQTNFNTGAKSTANVKTVAECANGNAGLQSTIPIGSFIIPIQFPAMFLRIALMTAGLSLTACGGGTSGGTNNPPLPPPASGAPPAITLSTVVSGLSSPVGMESAHDGTGRSFVLQQAGIIRIVQNGAVSPTPFLDISALVESGGEKGLLGLAFHPSFSTNRKFYVDYTRRTGMQLQTIIAEYLVSASNPNAVDTSTARTLLTIDQPFDNHNGGQLAFGADGFLYIGMGDGGSGGDPQGNGQNTNALLGKILRIDVNTTSAGKPYGIPAGNPFAASGGAPEVYAYGFRNPWRFSFDNGTSRLFVGDVGQDAFEEVDIVEIGKNYGWNVMEGTHCYGASTCSATGLIPPITDYPHSEGQSVTGGFVYRGAAIPGMVGRYIFADFISGKIWILTESGTTWNRTLALSTGRGISSFARDDNNEV
jgi:glucose/arabinose dehydrogenase